MNYLHNDNSNNQFNHNKTKRLGKKLRMFKARNTINFLRYNLLHVALGTSPIGKVPYRQEAKEKEITKMII